MTDTRNDRYKFICDQLIELLSPARIEQNPVQTCGVVLWKEVAFTVIHS